jgi:hypothetical protein
MGCVPDFALDLQHAPNGMHNRCHEGTKRSGLKREGESCLRIESRENVTESGLVSYVINRLISQRTRRQGASDETVLGGTARSERGSQHRHLTYESVNNLASPHHELPHWLRR